MRDIVARETLYWHVEFVAHIPPKGTEHLVVELVGTPVSHQFVGLAQASCRHLVGLLSTHLTDVGIVDGSLAEYHEERYEGNGKECKGNPIGSRTEEEIVDTMQLLWSSLDMTNVLVEKVNIRTREIAHSAALGSLGDIKREAFALDGGVFVGGSVVIDELHRWYLEFSCISRYGDEIVYHTALNTIGRELGLVGDLGVITVEILGEYNHWLLDKL